MRFRRQGVPEKQAAEISTKGVVGQMGNNRPTAPRTRNKKPIAVRSMVFSCKLSPPFIVLGLCTISIILLVYFVN